MLHQGLVNIDFDNNKIKFVSNGHIISKEISLESSKKKKYGAKEKIKRISRKGLSSLLLRYFI